MRLPTQAPLNNFNRLGRNTSAGISFRTLLGLLLVLILFGLAATAWGHTIREIIRDYSALPFGDYWRVAQNLREYKALNFGVLWRQHNEHRIVFPEIVFAADMLLWRGRELLPLAVSFLCYFASWGLMGWALLRESDLPLLHRLMAIGLAGYIIGWPGSSAVLSWAFLLQWTIVQLAAIVAFFLLALAAESASRLHFAGVIASAVVATFSSGNGLVLWPILLLSGVVLALNRRRMIILLLAAVASIGTFFCGYRSLGSTNLPLAMHHPHYFLGFLASYLSMPFGAIKPHPRLGLYLGMSYLAILLILIAVAVRARIIRSAAFITFSGFCVFAMVGAVLTALGRMDPTDQNFAAAKVPRYITLPILSWAALVLLLLWVSSRLSWKMLSPVRINVVLTLLLVLIFPKLRPWIHSVESDFAETQWAELSIESGLADPGMLHKVFPDAGFVSSYLPQLRSSPMSIFGEDYDKLLGKPIKPWFTVRRDKSQPGEITRAWPILYGLQVSGWASGLVPSQRILFLNDAGRIVGFGRRLPAGFPRDLPSTALLRNSGWVGFVNFHFGGEAFSAYAAAPDGRSLLPIGEAIKAPPIRAATLEEAGAPIDGVTWHMDKTWTENGIPPVVDPGVLPSKHFFASWSGGDFNTGRIASSDLAVPANNCIILPVLHGPSVEGLSAQILDAASGEPIAYLPLQDADTKWTFWRIHPKSSVRTVRVAAEDAGPYWGQWLALGLPSQCRALLP